MQIVLMRHGRPAIETGGRMSAAGFGRWVADYDAAGIDTGLAPPAGSLLRAGECAFIACSNLPRSVESARGLGLNRIDASDPLFRELEMPYAEWRFPRLSPLVWSVLFRLAWVCGYSANSESYAAARGRARACAERLEQWAAQHRTVLLVGHGTLNHFVAKELKAMGWEGPARAPRRYWESCVYRLPGRS